MKQDSPKSRIKMYKFLLAASFCLVGLVSLSTSQNVEAMCRQLYTDCQACQVFQTECRRPSSHPTHKPTHPQRPEPPAPAKPSQAAPVWPPPQNTPAPSRPQNTPAPSRPQKPTYPDSPDTSQPVYPTNPPQHNCVQYGQWCKNDRECCTKNCQLELVSMGPEHPDQHFTQSVCR